LSVHVAWTVRRNSYFDSIDLMRVGEQARQLAGVSEVGVVMGTPPGRAMLVEAGMWPSEAPEAGPSDLLIAVRADSEALAHRALAHVEELLSASRDNEPARPDARPRTTASAARVAAPANIAVIAVPGAQAALDAQQALSAGLHVFLFSDGVSLDDEVGLKRRARARGLLVMGPECGTAIINGVGLGFANRVRRGSIGVVGASGTGIQEVTSLVHRLGGGISHAVGTGGRDLHATVGGLTTLQALEALGADVDTRVVLVVSKPPSPRVADAVLRAAVATRKSVVACLLGYEGATPSGVRTTAALDEAAVAAVGLAGGADTKLERPALPAGAARGAVRGLYAGGTLCDEARGIVGSGPPHRFVDFGAEEYTRGRPHPIIDPGLRNAALLDAGADPGVSVILLDLVLGDCAHPDPAAALRPALIEARGRRRGRALTVVAHVVGTDQDPQSLAQQERELRELGVIVCASNRIAAETARALAEAGDGA
jgi:succinyl-CoA synthetase alpha subunit